GDAFRMRVLLASVGAMAGLSLHLLIEVMAQDMLPDRAALGLGVFGAVFFGAFLAMAGPLAAGRAALGAVGVALAVTALLSWAALRHPQVTGLFQTPFPALAAAALSFLPLPFWMAAQGPRGWRDDEVLFTQSWTIVVRYGAAWLFAGLVWAMLLLSGALLSLVGLDLIDALVDVAPVPFVLTGAALGLGLAVVTEMAEVVSPYLILRLMRLMVPPVLAAVALFLVALPLHGMAPLLGGLSVAATLLAIVAAAVTLVSTAVDATDSEAVQSPVLRAATRALAALVAPPAVLAGWAIWLRVADAGWTPARVAAAAVAAVALGYGLVYLRALLAGPDWMARIRSGNRGMALAILALAGLSLTPALDAEAISARSQLARFDAGAVDAANLDLAALSRWGHAGAAALAALEARATQPGQAALAARLEDRAGWLLPQQAEPEVLRAELQARMPIRPADAGAERDAILAMMEEWELQGWADSCRLRLPDGAPGCVLVVADFWPDTPGREAMFLGATPSGWLRQEAMIPAGDGAFLRAGVAASPTMPATPDDAARLLGALQAGDPVLDPVPRFQLRTPAGGLSIQP
ncbi:MAG TPA: hypothetical protein VLA78_15115, partial [Paracoccaceae bacterium]|nr:hypothetical protein [Paracoccaceae bacterium]